MRVLLSAYACAPDKGSEPGKGWNWALGISRLHHEVWVLTRSADQAAIESHLAKSGAIPNVRFVYYDLPGYARWMRSGPGGIYRHYLLWQWGAYRLARKLIKEKQFDRVHHITYGGVRQPSFMGRLGVPFIFGPVAGGDSAPWRLRFGYGMRGWLSDGLRDLSNKLVCIDPLMRQTFRRAQQIYVTSEPTLALLPRRYRSKSIVQFAIGYSEEPPSSIPTDVCDGRGTAFRALFVGRMLHWKGMHLGLAALARLLATHPDSRLTMVGEGPYEGRWRKLAARLGINSNVDWIPWVERSKLQNIYRSHDVFLFPSLHDSGGWVVLEALGYNLPVVCLDIGGPGILVDATCGRVIRTSGATKEDVIAGLANALAELADDPILRRSLGARGSIRAREYLWSVQVERLYRPGDSNIEATAP